MSARYSFGEQTSRRFVKQALVKTLGGWDMVQFDGRAVGNRSPNICRFHVPISALLRFGVLEKLVAEAEEGREARLRAARGPVAVAQRKELLL